MTSKNSLIVSVTRKHKLHSSLIAQLHANGYDVEEMALPSENAGTCSVTAEIDAKIKGLDLVIVYISADLAANVCIAALMRTAEKEGVRVVSIWLDDVTAGEIPQSVDSFSDAVTPYADDLSGVFSGEENPWTLPDGEEPTKRKIKKHTCG
ncbi:hypothetical protein ACVCIC_30900 [Burkholderia glumae]